MENEVAATESHVATNDPWENLKKAGMQSREFFVPMEGNIPADIETNVTKQQAFDSAHGVKPFHYTPLPIEDEKETKPGVFEGVAHVWKDFSLTGNLISDYQKHQALKAPNLDADSPSEDIIPQDWSSMDNEDLFKQTSRKYWDLLQMAKSPADQEARFKYAQLKQKEDEYYANGSFFQKLVSYGVGVPAGLIIDWPTLVPWAQAVKYAKISQNILYNAPRDAALIAGISGIEETGRYALDPDKRLGDVAENTLFDTMAGTFMMGAGHGFSAAYRGYKLKKTAPNVLKANSEGVEVGYNLTEDGEIINANAKAAPNEALSAARLSNDDLFYSSKFNQSGLFVVPKVQNVFSKVSPVMRGLTSSYGAVNHYTNAMVSHSINTIGGKKTIPQGFSFQDRMYQLEGQSTKFGFEMEGLRKQYNGIELTGSEEESLKKLNSTLNKKDPDDPASFGYQVALATIMKQNHEALQVNEAKDAWGKFTNDIRTRWLNAYGYDAEHVGSWNDEGYFSRVYNRYQISRNKNDFINFGVTELKEQDEIIKSVMKPLDDIEGDIKYLEDQILSGTNLELNRNQLAEAKAARSKIFDDLQEEIRDNPSHLLLLDEAPLSSADSKGLSSFLKPLAKLKDEKGEIQSLVSKAKTDRSRLKQKMTKVSSKKKTPEQIQATFEKDRARMDELEASIAEHEASLNAKESEILEENFRLNDEAASGNIPKSWFTKDPETGFIHFKDPNARPKFRPLYRDHEHMEEEVQGTWDTLMNLSDDEIAQQAMTGVHDFFSSNASRKRTVMFRTKSLLTGGWLSTDLPSMAHNYAMSMGKSAALEESLSQFKTRYGTRTGLEGMYKSLRDEHTKRLREIDALPEKKQKKAKDKEFREYDSTKKFVSNFQDALMGKPTGSREITKFAQVLKNMAAYSKLGFVPLTQMSDMGGMMFKNGPFAFFRDGFGPAVASMNGLIKSKKSIQRREQISEALIGIEGFRTNLTKKFYGSDPYNDITPNSTVARYIDDFSRSAAHVTTKFTLMNWLENFNRFNTAAIAQSRIMKLLDRSAQGKLSERQRQNLSLLGIEAKEWTPVFMEQFKNHGEKGIAGGYQSNYHLWENTAAKNKMSQAILMAVNDTVIKRQAGNEPFWVSNPMMSIVTQFMGWGFSAFNRYTIPFLQRADAHQVIGTVAMGLIGSLEECLRKWARGEEVDLDNDKLIIGAFSNSAPFAMLYKAAMMSNVLLESKTLESLKNDKQRGILALGMIGGPAFGWAKDFTTGLQMFGTGKFNQDGFKKFARTIPATQWWWTYRASNAFLGKLTEGLPRTKEQASSYWE